MLFVRKDRTHMTNNEPKNSRSEQSRINGAKSNGPTTPEGKAVSSRNALKHGFAAVINNVIAIEDKEAFEQHAAGYRVAFTPQNYFEETLVDQLASVNWRQTRLAGLETAILDAQLSVQKLPVNATQPDGEVDPYMRLVYAWQSLARKTEIPQDPTVLAVTFDLHCLELVRRYITTLDRQYRNTILNLRQYRKDFAPPQLAPERDEPENVPPQPPPAAAEAVEKPKNEAPRNVVHPINTAKPTLVTSKPATTTENPNRNGSSDRKDRNGTTRQSTKHRRKGLVRRRPSPKSVS